MPAGADVTADPPDRRVRDAGRVVVLDPDGACLLAHVTGMGRPWLFTPGGGAQQGEDTRAAARRELAEETSLEVAELAGPVLLRRAHLTFLGDRIEAREVFWVARVPQRPAATAGRLDEYEVDLLGDWVWMTPAEVRATPTTVYPHCLADLLATLARPDDPRNPLVTGRPWVEVDTASGVSIATDAARPGWAPV
jgi:8-oxo-dGTP pyrophosphatase MutT (NUDIX family)